MSAGPRLARLGLVWSLLRGDPHADRAVPPTGFTARLTVLTAAAMAFLAVFALALASTSGRLAERWGEELARTSTLRISAPAGQIAPQTEAALALLATTPGVGSARALTPEEQQALLAPWFGADLPLDALPVPQLIEIVETGDGIDATGLRARLQAEVPGAVYEDHSRWRAPLTQAAGRLRLLAVVSVLLIAGATAAMITLAAQAALAANEQVIRVMRLVGAKDGYIARAFVRRFTLRALIGATVGSAAALVALLLLPRGEVAGGFLTGLGFEGAGWLWPFLVPPLAALVAFLATRAAALRSLGEQT